LYPLIESEIKALEKNLRNYEQRKANLLQALEPGDFRKDEVCVMRMQPS